MYVLATRLILEDMDSQNSSVTLSKSGKIAVVLAVGILLTLWGLRLWTTVDNTITVLLILVALGLAFYAIATSNSERKKAALIWALVLALGFSVLVFFGYSMLRNQADEAVQKAKQEEAKKK